MAVTQAVCKAPSRKIFAPMFRARWQNMQNVINDSQYLDLIPSSYKNYYQTYITQWKQWMQGFVPQLHQKDFFSTGMGYTVCDILTKKCMAGGFRIQSKDQATQKFFEEWAENSDITSSIEQMYFFANGVGNAILVLTPINGDIYLSVYPIFRAVFEIGKTKKISQILLLNRFVAGENTYYAREKRVIMKGKPYWKVELAMGNIITSPSWTNSGINIVPDCIKTQWESNYGDIEPNKWYEMPERFEDLGCYNVQGKPIAVAIPDMPGYADSSLHTALDVLYSIDFNYTQAQVDQYMGRSRAIIPKQMQGINFNRLGILDGAKDVAVDGQNFHEAINNTEQPLDETFYDELPDTNLNGDRVQPTFIQPDLRGEVRKYIRDGDLELLASKVGLSASDLASHLVTNGMGAKTDDEINAESSATETTINSKRRLASNAINKMLQAVAHFYGKTEDVNIQWGQRTANTARENEELMADYNAGTLPLRAYLRRRWSDLNEEEIEKLAVECENENALNNKNNFGYEYGGMMDDSEQTAEYSGDKVGRSGNAVERVSEE